MHIKTQPHKDICIPIYKHTINKRELKAYKKDIPRICIDCRALNSNTIIDTYSIQCIDDIFDHLQGPAIFIKIYLAQSYYQVKIYKGYKHRTAFQMCFGLFDYPVLLFGLYNTPPTFQRLMHKILQVNLDAFSTMYLDGICLFSWSTATYKQHLCWVL